MIEKMITFLKLIEWSGDNVNYICPVCRRWQVQGHEADCELVKMQAELGACEQQEQEQWKIAEQVESAIKRIKAGATWEPQAESAGHLRSWLTMKLQDIATALRRRAKG